MLRFPFPFFSRQCFRHSNWFSSQYEETTVGYRNIKHLRDLPAVCFLIHSNVVQFTNETVSQSSVKWFSTYVNSWGGKNKTHPPVNWKSFKQTPTHLTWFQNKFGINWWRKFWCRSFHLTITIGKIRRSLLLCSWKHDWTLNTLDDQGRSSI